MRASSGRRIGFQDCRRHVRNLDWVHARAVRATAARVSLPRLGLLRRQLGQPVANVL
jgi:hypothetical protein